MASNTGDTPPAEVLLTPREAIAVFGARGRKVDYKYLRRLADAGHLTARRTVGGHRRFTARSIAQYLAHGGAS